MFCKIKSSKAMDSNNCIECIVQPLTGTALLPIAISESKHRHRLRFHLLLSLLLPTSATGVW